MPPAPDGLDKADGTGRFTDLAAAVTAGGTALNASVINRQDLLGMEVWCEDIETNDAVYPLGNVQYGASTYEGITLSNTVVAQTYSAFGEWDTATTGYGLKWSTATEAEKLTFINRKENNIYRDAETGKTIQVRYRARSIAGLGQEWENVTNVGTSALYFNTLNFVDPRGQLTTFNDFKAPADPLFYMRDNVGRTTKDAGILEMPSDDTIAHDGKAYFIPIATVDRRNQGAYHPVLNANGCAYFRNATSSSIGEWYSVQNNRGLDNVSDLFDFTNIGWAGSGNSGPATSYLGAIGDFTKTRR